MAQGANLRKFYDARGWLCLYKRPGRKEPVDAIRYEDNAGTPYRLD
jgi:hypothetical protein